jgi:hypothetical protein
MRSQRPHAITALSLFFGAGAFISFTAAVALFMPGGFLEPMWRLNPRARVGFASMGGWAPLLLFAVCLTCAAAAFGLWQMRRWGYRLALGLLLVNLTGDVLNTLLGTEPRAAVGIPIVLLLLAYFARSRIRAAFGP